MNPRTSQKQPLLHEMEGVAQIWHYLVESGNIQPKNYDADLVLQLCNSLRIAGDATAFITGSADFGRAMQDHNISREDFIHGLFSAAQPFAEMMAQLCSFFERHAVQGTGLARRTHPQTWYRSVPHSDVPRCEVKPDQPQSKEQPHKAFEEPYREA